MRMLLNVTLPHEQFNAAVRDGTAGRKLSKILEEIKPEACYFTEQEGRRGGIPSLAEPWFLSFNADVEFRVVMTPEELGRAGLEGVGKKWGS